MALARLQKDLVYRLYLASPLAFANWQTPTVAEMNANPTNSPDGLIFNLSCALDTGSTTFDLDDPDTDDSTVFCQDASESTIKEQAATIVYGVQLSKERWTVAETPTAANGYNASTLAQSLLAYRGVEYFAIMSVGKGPDAPFASGDRLKMAEVATDWGIPDGGTGSNLIMTQTFAKRSRLNWNYKLV